MTDDAATARQTVEMCRTFDSHWNVSNEYAVCPLTRAVDVIAKALRSAREDGERRERARIAEIVQAEPCHHSNVNVRGHVLNWRDALAKKLALSSAPARDAPAETKCETCNGSGVFCGCAVTRHLLDATNCWQKRPCPSCSPARDGDADRALGANLRAIFDAAESTTLRLTKLPPLAGYGDAHAFSWRLGVSEIRTGAVPSLDEAIAAARGGGKS